MKKVEKNNLCILTCERREFLKWTAAGSAALMFLDFDHLLAAGVGDFASGIAPDIGEAADPNFYYWLDGPFGTQFGTGFENGLDRQKLAILVDVDHNKNSFVEGIYVTDQSRKIVASQKLFPEQATSKGKAPYVVFDNIRLEQGQSYFIYYVLTEGTVSKIHRYQLVSNTIEQSRLDYIHFNATTKAKVPQIIMDDMVDVNTFHRIAGRDEGGWITTPYQGIQAVLPSHMVRAKLKSLQANGAFSFDIAQMHADVNADHYMRYFLVLDPVGRVLGGLRRTFGDTVYVNGNFHTVTNNLIGMDAPSGGGVPSSLNIADCPYVQVFTEDCRDAICRITYRLR